MRLSRSRDDSVGRGGALARRARFRSVALVALIPAVAAGCTDTDGPLTIELACPKDWTVRWSDSSSPYRAVIDSDVSDRPLEQYLACAKLDDRAGWIRSSNVPQGWDAEFTLPKGAQTRGGRTGGSASVRVRALALGVAVPPGFPPTDPRSRLIAEVTEG